MHCTSIDFRYDQGIISNTSYSRCLKLVFLFFTLFGICSCYFQNDLPSLPFLQFNNSAVSF